LLLTAKNYYLNAAAPPGDATGRWEIPFDSHAFQEAAAIIGYHATFFKFLNGTRTTVDFSTLDKYQQPSYPDTNAYIYLVPKEKNTTKSELGSVV
jgi:hypothetical protein